MKLTQKKKRNMPKMRDYVWTSARQLATNQVQAHQLIKSDCQFEQDLSVLVRYRSATHVMLLLKGVEFSRKITLNQ
jgi:hypothetical protein